MSRISTRSKTDSSRVFRLWPIRALVGVLLIGAAPLLAGSAVRLAALLGYPFPHDGLEGTLLYEARLLWAGEPLYQPLERLRFVSAPYPPLHPLLLGLVDQFAGPHVFWSGRLLSLLAALGVGALIVIIVRRSGGGWLGGWLGAALFFGAPPVILWATRIKPDMLALLFTTLGLSFATLAATSVDRTKDQKPKTKRSAQSHGPWSFVLGPWSAAAVCFVLAFFTKQTAVAAPLASALALLLVDIRHWRAAGPERHGSAGGAFIGRLPLRKRTLLFGLTYAGLSLGAWVLLDLATNDLFSAHVWGLHRGDWWSAVLLRKFVALLVVYLPAMLLAVACVIYALRRGRALVPACYVLVAPISLLGAGETGANHNHLLETILALALAAGCMAGTAVSWLRAPGAPRGTRAGMLARPLAWSLLLVLAAQVAIAYRPPQWYGGELVPPDTPARFIAFIQATPGEVLADDVGLLVAAGRPLRYDDPSTMGPAAASGVWDQGGLLDDIAARRFSAILLPIDLDTQTSDPSGRWTPEVLAAIRAHYRLAFRDTVYTYMPR
jgi:hypothetical protein